MDNNELWEIESFDSESTIKRTKMMLKKGDLKLTLHALAIPTSWSVGDKVGDFKLREDASPGYVNLSNKSNDRANKPKEGPIQARVIDDPNGFMKSLASTERTEYPHLGEEEKQKITKIESPRIWLGDNCKSRWYFHPATDPLPEDWVVGDTVIVDHAGAVRKGDKKINYQITNTRTKQGALGSWENLGEKTPESYPTEKGSKRINYDPPAEELSSGEFDKFGEELIIKAVSEEFIWLHGGWKFRWHSIIGHHGEWKRGDRVIVTKSDTRSNTKMYTIMNVETGKFLTITPAEEDE